MWHFLNNILRHSSVGVDKQLHTLFAYVCVCELSSFLNKNVPILEQSKNYLATLSPVKFQVFWQNLFHRANEPIGLLFAASQELSFEAPSFHISTQDPGLKGVVTSKSGSQIIILPPLNLTKPYPWIFSSLPKRAARFLLSAYSCNAADIGTSPPCWELYGFFPFFPLLYSSYMQFGTWVFPRGEPAVLYILMKWRRALSHCIYKAKKPLSKKLALLTNVFLLSFSFRYADHG